MAEAKTKPNDASVKAFLDSIEHEQRREDCRAVVKLMRRVSRKQPKMWGDSIIGFGSYHFRYASGRTGDWPLTGVSPRKQRLVLYIMAGFRRYDSLMKRLGKHKVGKSCLYVNKLDDVDLDVLEELVRESMAAVKAREAERA